MPRVTTPEDGVFDFPFAEKTVLVAGREYTFRELSVIENDQAAEKSKQPDGNIDGRLMMKFMVAAASVAPTIDVATLGKIPNRIYLQFATVVNELNAPPDEEASPKND